MWVVVVVVLALIPLTVVIWPMQHWLQLPNCKMWINCGWQGRPFYIPWIVDLQLFCFYLFVIINTVNKGKHTSYASPDPKNRSVGQGVSLEKCSASSLCPAFGQGVQLNPANLKSSQTSFAENPWWLLGPHLSTPVGGSGRHRARPYCVSTAVN